MLAISAVSTPTRAAASVPPSKARPGGGVSSRLDSLVLRALACDRDDRYESMEQFRAAIDDLLREIDPELASRLTTSGASPRFTPLPPRITPPAGPTTLEQSSGEISRALPRPSRRSGRALVGLAAGMLIGGAAVALLLAIRTPEPMAAAAGGRAPVPSPPPPAPAPGATMARAAGAAMIEIAPDLADRLHVARSPAARRRAARGRPPAAPRDKRQPLKQFDSLD